MVGGFVVQTIIELAEVVLERGIDEAVAYFHGCGNRLDFSIGLCK